MFEAEKRYDKYYFEAYAALTLSMFFRIPLEEINFADRPDLQCERLGIGIEVTQAITETEAIYYSLVNKYFSKGYSGEFIKEKIEEENKKGKFKGEVDAINNTAWISPTKGFMNPENYLFTEIEKSVQDKLKKLNGLRSENNKGYKKFHSNGLYLFTSSYCSYPEDLRLFLSKIDTDDFEIAFDLYYINCLNKIYVYQTKTKQLAEQPVTKEQLRVLKENALYIAGFHRAKHSTKKTNL